MSWTDMPASRPSGIRLFPEELLPFTFARVMATSAPPMIFSPKPVASSRVIMPR